MLKKSVTTGIALTMFILSQFFCAGCAIITSEAPIGKGYKFQIESIGSRAEVRNICLTFEQIRTLIPGSHIPPGATEASCYQVFFITSSTSAITNSIKEFLVAKDEFDSTLGEILKARNIKDAGTRVAAVTASSAAAVTPTRVVSNAATTAIVSDALDKKPEEVKARAEAVGRQLTEPQKEGLIRNLEEIKSETANDKVKEGVNAAIESLQPK